MTTLTRYVWGDLDCCTVSDYHEKHQEINNKFNFIVVPSDAGNVPYVASLAGLYGKGLPPPRLFPDSC